MTNRTVGGAEHRTVEGRGAGPGQPLWSAPSARAILGRVQNVRGKETFVPALPDQPRVGRQVGPPPFDELFAVAQQEQWDADTLGAHVLDLLVTPKLWWDPVWKGLRIVPDPEHHRVDLVPLEVWADNVTGRAPGTEPVFSFPSDDEVDFNLLARLRPAQRGSKLGARLARRQLEALHETTVELKERIDYNQRLRQQRRDLAHAHAASIGAQAQIFAEKIQAQGNRMIAAKGDIDRFKATQRSVADAEERIRKVRYLDDV